MFGLLNTSGTFILVSTSGFSTMVSAFISTFLKDSYRILSTFSVIVVSCFLNVFSLIIGSTIGFLDAYPKTFGIAIFVDFLPNSGSSIFLRISLIGSGFIWTTGLDSDYFSTIGCDFYSGFFSTTGKGLISACFYTMGFGLREIGLVSFFKAAPNIAGI